MEEGDQEDPAQQSAIFQQAGGNEGIATVMDMKSHHQIVKNIVLTTVLGVNSNTHWVME